MILTEQGIQVVTHVVLLHRQPVDDLTAVLLALLLDELELVSYETDAILSAEPPLATVLLRPVAPSVLTVAVPHVIFERPNVYPGVIIPFQSALAFFLIVGPLAGVGDPLRPGIGAFAVDFTVFELAPVYAPIRERHFPDSLLETVNEATFEA